MSTYAKQTVRVTDENGRHVFILAGDEVPGWAREQITNEAVFTEDAGRLADVDTPVDAETGAPVDAGGGADYESMTVAELRSAIEDRNAAGADLSVEGKKADLVAALTAHDDA